MQRSLSCENILLRTARKRTEQILIWEQAGTRSWYPLCHWLFLNQIFWMENRICCWHSVFAHSAATSWIWIWHVARTTPNSNLNLIVILIKDWAEWREVLPESDLLSVTSKQQSLQFVQCTFFGERKQLCARVKKFPCSQRHRGCRRWEKESEWYYKYCLVGQGWLKTTFINIMKRLEETEDSHDLHAIADGGRSAFLPGSTLPPPLEKES